MIPKLFQNDSKNYFKMIDSLDELDKLQFMSKSGKNYGYSAQCMARYIFDSEQYEEQHTALEDSKMEFELARHFARKHKTDFEKTFLTPEIGRNSGSNN